MAYEIDFVGCSDVKKDYDAIAFRFRDGHGDLINCVFDGGTEDAYKTLSLHLEKYYSIAKGMPVDYVFCSHPHIDHASGLKGVLEEFGARCLVMNRPWQHIDDLLPHLQNGNWSEKGLERYLRENYPYINVLEEIANRKNIRIVDAFRGDVFAEYLTILSPSHDEYIEYLVESDKTPKPKSIAENASVATDNFSAREGHEIASQWGVDALEENPSTEPDNETSLILYGHPDAKESFLLTADAGIRALDSALRYARSCQFDMRQLDFVEMPHHGSRHNVNSMILDSLLGNVVPKMDVDKLSEVYHRASFVSIAKGSDHPRKAVVNAFLHRGWPVYVSADNTVRHHRGDMPPRNWENAKVAMYSPNVEAP